MVAQGAAGVLAAVQTTALKLWDDQVDEAVDVVRHPGREDHETVSGTGGEPLLEDVGNARWRADDLLEHAAPHYCGSQFGHGEVIVTVEFGRLGERRSGVGRECRHIDDVADASAFWNVGQVGTEQLR